MDDSLRTPADFAADLHEVAVWLRRHRVAPLSICVDSGGVDLHLRGEDFRRLKIVVEEEREAVRGWVKKRGLVNGWRVSAMFDAPTAEGGRA
ncbi:hypothetical protein L6R50_21345 [Myxococcota bacterium]|nr:hypothetical protein [Myxococcota bacterium]